MTCITSIIGDDREMLEDAFEQMAYNWADVTTASWAMAKPIPPRLAPWLLPLS